MARDSKGMRVSRASRERDSVGRDGGCKGGRGSTGGRGTMSMGIGGGVGSTGGMGCGSREGGGGEGEGRGVGVRGVRGDERGVDKPWGGEEGGRALVTRGSKIDESSADGGKGSEGRSLGEMSVRLGARGEGGEDRRLERWVKGG